MTVTAFVAAFAVFDAVVIATVFSSPFALVEIRANVFVPLVFVVAVLVVVLDDIFLGAHVLVAFFAAASAVVVVVMMDTV